jgi:DNA sulfur modification protein DndD
MKLESMRLYNFRQFYGEQRIRFSIDKKKNVTIINGIMGAGKTSLHRAFVWCLYGEWDEQTRGQIVNKRAINESPLNFKVETSVQMVFTHAGERYTAVRTLQVVKTSESTWQPVGESGLSLTKITLSGQHETIRNAQNLLEFILPSSVSPYFFFDGEQIDEFVKPGHETKVKSAVRNVLRIEVLERARHHLDTVARDYQKDLKSRASGRLQLILVAKEGAQSELDDEQKRLEELRTEKGLANKQIEELNERLHQIESVKEWEEKRRGVQSQLQSCEKAREHIWAEVKDLVNRSYVQMSMPVILKATKLLDEKRERGEIPPGIREQFIQDLLNRGECICKRPIIDGSPEYEHLVRLLQRSVPTYLTNAVVQCAGDLRSLTANTGDTLGQIKEKMVEKAKMEDDIDAYNQELTDISQHLLQFDLEEVRLLEKKRKDHQDRLYSIIGDIGRKEERIEVLRRAIETSQHEIEKAQVSEKRARRLQKSLSLATRAHEAVDRMCDVFAADMRKRIQTEAKQIFQRLVWKESQFQDICLSEDYSLEVLDRWGLPARRELSAGERQVLSLAFIIAMARVAGEEAPLVVDTPFGRLSSAPRQSITKNIPELLEQLILFVTDEELREQARQNLVPRIGVEYELRFDQETGSATVVQLN